MTALFLLPFLLQSPAASGECAISGRVYNASTGAPLKKAQVRAAPHAVTGRPSGSSSTTDAEGFFHFDHLAPGQYGLYADRTGFIASGGDKTTCGARDVSIKLTPQGMIYGRVIDDDGEPVPAALVMVYRRTWFRGHRQLVTVSNSTSQADGSLVLGNLPTGNYYVSAKGIVHGGPEGEAPVENYFPNTPDQQAAVAINLTAGTDLRGLNLRVRTARVYNVRGTAFTPDGDPVRGTQLMLMSVDSNQRVSSAGTTGGSFEFHNVSPGNYVIQALPLRGGNAGISLLTAYLPVTVADADVEDLTVRLANGAEITGTVTLDDAPFDLHGVTLLAEPVDGRGINNGAQIKGGAFAFPSLAPTRYHVVVQNLLDGYYIKKMKFDGRDLVGRELDLSANPSGALEIQISSKPGAISGTARASNGDPLPDAIVSVWTNNDPDIRVTRTDASGRFSLHNFAPGDYRVLGWEQMERGLLENPAFRLAFESQAAVVTVQESSQANADLNVVPKTAIDAAQSKLP